MLLQPEGSSPFRIVFDGILHSDQVEKEAFVPLQIFMGLHSGDSLVKPENCVSDRFLFLVKNDAGITEYIDNHTGDAIQIFRMVIIDVTGCLGNFGDVEFRILLRESLFRGNIRYFIFAFGK